MFIRESECVFGSSNCCLSTAFFSLPTWLAIVTEPATKYYTEQMQPYLPAVLEELMGPISLGFTEARDLSEGMMEQLCQDFQDTEQREELRQVRKTNKFTFNHHKNSL